MQKMWIDYKYHAGTID